MKYIAGKVEGERIERDRIRNDFAPGDQMPGKRNTTLSPAADAFMRMLLRDGYQGNAIPMQGTPAA
ncbi:MAG: hypothetical protein CVU19_02615 [Betaproteobacteria bacterium HGW-Betaproteobacteria-13]|jgi:hypothetical protein|nr:MAG: hypothetical protein CVU28_05495 [Betaproteobacteria bacterium HGW-Betaproteobacteria-21]PKO82218.1 MAG: hypothetical protein CVU19_02615 [Betaproteobacteria bacterium HGW-Betaproteobacteria-13]